MAESSRQRLARIMDERRRFLRLTWDQVAERGSISYETIRQVRSGSQDLRALTKRGIEIGLGWTPGSLDRVLDGGEAGEVRPPPPDTPPRAPSTTAEIAMRQIIEVLDIEGLTNTMRLDTIRGIVYRYERDAVETSDDVGHRAEAG